MSALSPTAERREAMLGELAEWLHAAAHKTQRMLMESEDTDEVVRLAGSLSKLARGVRQCVLMHDRLEGQRVAAETAAEAERSQAEAASRAAAVDRLKARVSDAVGDRFYEEWPDDDDPEENQVFNERLERLDVRLDDLAETEGFLDTDADALIAQLCREFGIAPPAPNSPFIPTNAGTQADSPLPQSLNGSPLARGGAGEGTGAPNTS